VGRDFSTLDEAKGISGGWSERGVEQALWTAQAVGSYREAEEALERLGGLSVPRSALHRKVEEHGSRLAKQRKAEAQQLWEQGEKGEALVAPRDGAKEELGISLDGGMVWVDDGWHEVKVGCCFEFGPGKDGEIEARELGYWAHFGEVEDFRRTLWGYAYHRGLGLEGKAIVIGDGAPWIDRFAEKYCARQVRIVDWYHALEHLWALGREAFGEKRVAGSRGWSERCGTGRRGRVWKRVKRRWRSKRRGGMGSSGRRNTFAKGKPGWITRLFVRQVIRLGAGRWRALVRGLAGVVRGAGSAGNPKLNAMLALRSAGMDGKREWAQAWKLIGNTS